MVQSIHAVLRNALESAVREEIVPRNVAKLVQVPSPRYKINRGLTTQQAKATLHAAAGHRLEALYVLALFLGLRRGELLGLRWEDVDLDRAKLEVVQTLQRGRRVAALRPVQDGRFFANGPASAGVCARSARAQEAAIRRAVERLAGLGRSRPGLHLAAWHSGRAGQPPP